jgi:hypothetical protein
MRLNYKLAVIKSGRFQYEIAAEVGVSEGRFSRVIRGHEQLTPAEEQQLRTILGLTEDVDEAAHVS